MVMKQTIVEPAPISTVPPGTMGETSTAYMMELFPETPIGPHAANDTVIKLEYSMLAMRGETMDTFAKGVDTTSQAYWGFEAPFNRNYVGYGDLTPPDNSFVWENPGDPMNPWMPNLWSTPNADPTQQPPPLLTAVANPPISPKTTTEDFVKSVTGYGLENKDFLGNYVMGKSSLSPDLEKIENTAQYGDTGIGSPEEGMGEPG